MTQPLLVGFTIQENLSFVPFSTSASRALYSPFLIQIHLLHSWFLQPPSSLPNLPTLHSESASYFIPSHCNARSSSLHSRPKPHSWSHPPFPSVLHPGPVFLLFELTQTGSYFSHQLDGSRKNELFLYNCAVTSFRTLAKPSQIHENYDCQSRGQFLADAAKGMSLRRWQMLNSCSKTQQCYRFSRKLLQDI